MIEKYRGRFAPSPTGPLHFGSLVAATGSYLEALANQGEWLVRMEDLDPPREMPGAADQILFCLDAFGFAWDGEVIYQSQRHNAYQETLEQLSEQQLIYHCGCTRKELEIYMVYPGICRDGLPSGKQPRAVRVRTRDYAISFKDRLQGEVAQNLAKEVGDFVIKRADGFYAYQLAVVVDDAAQGITHIVRGSDLLGVTARQIYLQQILGFLTPEYTHLPIAVNAQGEKLSKQTYAKALDMKHPTPQLWLVLAFLGQQPPEELRNDRIEVLWQWAQENWYFNKIPNQPHLAPTY